MFSTIFGFGYYIFITLVLLLIAGITAHLCYGYGTYKAKETYIMLILLLMIGTQMYYLINAATYIPASRFYTYNVRSFSLLIKNDNDDHDMIYHHYYDCQLSSSHHQFDFHPHHYHHHYRNHHHHHQQQIHHPHPHHHHNHHIIIIINII